jgi:hypothetical protein
MRDTITFGEGKDKAAMHFTDDVRRRGDAEAVVLGGIIGAQVRVLV